MPGTLFISHASTDQPLVEKLQEVINIFSADSIQVFASTIDSGSNWFESIQASLQSAEVLLILLTPNSIDRPWVWFEAGATWQRQQMPLDKKITIIPLIAGTDITKVPRPFADNQWCDLTKHKDIEKLFQTLKRIYQVGRLTNPKPEDVAKEIAEIISQIPLPQQDSISKHTLIQVLRHLVSTQTLKKPQLGIFRRYGLLSEKDIQDVE